MIEEWSDIERKNIIDLVKPNEDLFFLKGDKLYKLCIKLLLRTAQHLRNNRLPKTHKDFINSRVIDLLNSDIISPI